jgi:hypothetical protein
MYTLVEGVSGVFCAGWVPMFRLWCMMRSSGLIIRDMQQEFLGTNPRDGSIMSDQVCKMNM